MRALLAGQLVFVALLSLWLACWPPRSTAGLVVQGAGSLLGVLAIARAGVWLFPTWWTPWVATGTIVLATAWHALRPTHRSTWPPGAAGWIGLVVFLVIGATAGALLLQLPAAGRIPAQPLAIELDAPLARGRYLVVNGGGMRLLNAHRASMDTTHVRLRAWRGNGHAVDLVALDATGRRADGLLPHELTRYRSFGVPVLAPCAGTIIGATDGHPDWPPPRRDDAHPAGNHVLLECDGTHLVLAHLQQGSLRVAVGDHVAVGTPLGAVGNSGGTDEPHLHLHAQRPGPPGAPMAGDPVPIRVRGRYLVRGDRVTMP